MDLTSQPTQTTTTPINNNNGTTATTTTTNSFTKSPDTIKIQPLKSLTLMNGVLKRHHTHNQSHHGGTQAVTYKECLRNHVATIGGHALDGCGEFMPSPTATASDPTSLKCAACGCHRNFHRREPEDSFSPPPPPPSSRIEYQSHHRHHPPPPPAQPRSPNSSSPPPISSAYAPHMLLALSSHGVPGLPENFNANNVNVSAPSFSSTRKRFRTKFTQDQKERMFEFAEKLNWKMQKRDEDLIKEFCNEVKVDKGVLKVWMHNNKNTFNKRLETNKGFANECPNINYNVDIEDGRHNNSNSDDMMNHHHHHQQDFKIDIGGGVRHGTNGSSSTS